MASRSLLRRTLTLTPSTLTKSHRSLSSLPHSSITRSQISSPSSTPISPQNPSNYLKTQISGFRSSLPSPSSRSSYNDDEKISPDTILFEGCDYNHWLITMDFPKDPKPTPEEMVETYVQTLAKVVGSVEEAKKRMYACSTTTYNGFQAVMTEEMSEKFRGLPGVVFILPDSYIDPVNKEYGGDKYINGTIIPRPPPIQYSRQNRHNDRNRNRQGPPQGGDGRNYGGPRQDYRPPQNLGPSPSAPGEGRNYGAPQQNYGQPQQNYGAPQQNYGQPQPNYGQPQPNFGQPQQNYVPPQNLPPPVDGNKLPQQNHGPPQHFDSSPPPPADGRNYGVAQQSYRPPQNFGPAVPGDGRNYGAQQNYSPQRNLGSYPSGQGDGSSVGTQPNYGGQIPVGNRDYVPPENRDFSGNNRNTYPPAGDFSQGAGSSYGQSYPVHGEGQRYPPGNGRQ